MERIRSVTVTIEVDTNKQTHTGTIEIDEEESTSEFAERVKQAVVDAMEVASS